MTSTSTYSGHSSPVSLSRKNSNFNFRNIFRSSNKRHKSKESIDTVSVKSCEKSSSKSSEKKLSKSNEKSISKPIEKNSAKISEKNASKSSERNSSKSSDISKHDQAILMCNICFSWKDNSLFPVLLSCEHRNCIECLKQYLIIAVRECRVMVACPECSEIFHPSDVKMIFSDDNLYAKYEEFTLRRALVGIPDIRWCPAPDCGYAVIAAGCASCPQLKCMRPGCNYEFCYHCRQLWHPNTTCDLARMQNQFEIRSLASSERKSSNMQEDIKPCPKCMALIIKMDDGSCNHMTCAVCGGEFCWLCMKEISDLHYLSPSGCTFWGKKPWSRKKKIMWQMGTLIGAPVGIGLAAGVVLPAMMIGIPIYVGRRIRERFDYSDNMHKRNLAITGGVALSVIVSPFLAALTVGVGVPIALGYVYGVVPVSLCRSGGCTGVTTSRNGKGVNFEFGNERDEAYGSSTSSSVHHNNKSPLRKTSGNSSMMDTASVLTHTGSVLTVKGTISSKEGQPSITGSNDSTSLDSRSYIAPFHAREQDLESHASLIPAPRSTTVSITSSLENVHMKSVSTTNLCNAATATAAQNLPEVSCGSPETGYDRSQELQAGSFSTTSGTVIPSGTVAPDTSPASTDNSSNSSISSSSENGDGSSGLRTSIVQPRPSSPIVQSVA